MLAPLMLALAASAPCWPVLVAGRTFYFRDLHLFFLPQRALVARILREGRLPLWDPFMQGGSPLWANPDNLVAHPTTSLYVMFPTALAFGLDTALSLVLAALGSYGLARRLELSRAAAVVAGAVFSLSGVMLSLINLHPLLLTLAPLPALLWAWHAWLEGRSTRWLCVVIALAASCALGAAPEAAFAGVALVLAWTLAAPGMRSLRHRLIALAGCGIAAGALAAPGWLPAVETIRHSARGTGFPWAQATAWSLHPARLPELLVPGLMGRSDTLDVGDHWGLVLEGMYSSYFLSISLGSLAVVLAAAGCSRRSALPRALHVVLISFAALSIVLALGRFLPGASLLEEWRFPLRFPVKFLLLGALPTALLAAAGLDNMLARDWRRRRALGIALGALALVLASLALVPHVAPNVARRLALAWFERDAPAVLHGVSVAFFRSALEAGVGASIVLALRRDALVPVMRGLMAAAIVVSLVVAAAPVNPTAPRSVLEGEPSLATMARAAVGGGRLFRAKDDSGLRVTGDTNDAIHGARWDLAVLRSYVASRYGLPVVFHVDPDGLTPERMALLARSVEAVEWSRRLPVLESAGVRAVITAQRLAIEGMREVGSIDMGNESEVRLYSLERAASTARFVPRARAVPSDRAALEAVTDPSHDPRAEVVVVGGGTPPRNEGCTGRVEPDVVALDPPQDLVVDAGCAGFFVLAVPHQPGIEIEVDGVLQRILPADVAFCAVPVPQGRHLVRWNYRLRALPLSIAACGAGLLGTFVLAVAARRIDGRAHRATRECSPTAGGVSPG